MSTRSAKLDPPVLTKPQMIAGNPLNFGAKNSVPYTSLDAHSRET